ncbi:NAD(P)-binding protein [Mycena rebaudengoi]|nr:NAD(P)-binding protein [Mycena rebaudengoi]
MGFFSAPHFLPERDMPNLSGKITMVTGGNTGIGYETVKQLLIKDATVYLAARSESKGMDAIKKLEQETKKSAIFLQLDLADLNSVRQAAETFLEREKKLDILFNNGAVLAPPPEMVTVQNHDLQFGTNTIGHYFLTQLLLSAFTASYNETKTPARVINTSSDIHKQIASGIDFTSLKAGPERDAWIKKAGRFNGLMKLYAESKLGNIFVSNYFAKTHSSVLVSCALHPGVIKTDVSRHMGGFVRFIIGFFGFMAATPAKGAYTQLWAGTVAKPEEINGQYVVPWGKVGKADKLASNTNLEAEVVMYVKEQVKGF